MKQRIYSFILVFSLIIGSLCGVGGCGQKQVVADSNYITQGEWIALINEAFGMYYYESDTPYYTNVNASNPYFEQIQIAREWNIIDDSVDEFDTNAYVSYGFAAVTLVNATGFVDEEVSAGEKVNIAQELGIIVSEEKEYEVEDNITYSDAVVSLYYAKEQWANLTFDHVIEEVTFAEDVINYIEEDFTDYEIKDGKTYIPAYAYAGMEAGDVYVLPANKDNLVASAFIVENVTQEGDYYVIENSSDETDILEHIEELNIEETYTPDLLACDFYDADGNLLYSGSEYAYAQKLAAKEEYTAKNLSEMDDVYYDLTKVKGSKTFQIKSGKVTGSVTLSNDEVKFGVEYKLYENEYSTAPTAEAGNKNNGKESVKLFAEATIKDIEVTNDVDISWGKLKYARVSVDYETSIEGGLKASGSENILRAAPYNNGNGSFLTNLKRAIASDMVPAYARGAEQSSGKMKIGSFDLASIGIAKVKLEIYVYVEASGKISVKLTTVASKGIEYVNGNIRYINTDAHTRELNLNASIEWGLDFKLGVECFSLDVVSAELKLGIGIETKLVVNFVDEENHLIETGDVGDTDIGIFEQVASSGAVISIADMEKIAEAQGGVYQGTIVTEEIPLHIDNCLEANVYFKASLELSKGCLVDKVLKEKGPKRKVEFKETLLSVHLDNFGEDLNVSNIFTGVSTTCTKKFTPFKALEEELEEELEALEENTEYEWEVGEFLEILQYSMNLTVGQTDMIKVTKLPAEYSFEDVKFESGNSDIVQVSADGTILAIEEGVTYIRIYIPDTQYEMRCAIIVSSDGVIQYTPIEIV